MTEATCADCGQQWFVMPGDLASALDPDCQEKARKRRLAAEKARREALRAGRGA